jgi:2'-5' RNA ligase
VRLFFALWPDESVVGELAVAASLFKLEGHARLVPASNLHLTLAFIGEVADQKLAVLQQIGRDIHASAFTAVCDALEYWREPHAVVATMREPPAALLDLSQRLHDAVGLARSPFRAHVTLVRKVSQAPVLPLMSPIIWRATQFALVRSQTGGATSAYTVVDTWPLLYER